MEESTDRILDLYRNEVNKLQNLLNDPHPGLLTWCEAFQKRIQNIQRLWRNGSKIKEEELYK